MRIEWWLDCGQGGNRMGCIGPPLNPYRVLFVFWWALPNRPYASVEASKAERVCAQSSNVQHSGCVAH